MNEPRHEQHKPRPVDAEMPALLILLILDAVVLWRRHLKGHPPSARALHARHNA